MTYQADHLARFDDQIYVAGDRPRAVAETGLLQRDAAFDLAEMNRLGRFRHRRHMVEDVENTLGAGGGLLRHRNDAAHRVQPGVEAADVGEEGGQHANGDVAFGNLPDAEAPDDEQADFGHQRDGRAEQRPGAVEFVVERQVVFVGVAEALGLALFLGEGLDHADAGNGVGEHVGDFGPDPVNLLETGAQPVTDGMDQPGDERQRQQRDQRQPGIDREQDGRRHGDHQHVGGEVEQVQRQEDVDAVGFRTDARHQVAGALAAEILQ